MLLAVSAALLATQAHAQPAAAPNNPAPTIRREFRGAWVASVANIDWPSRPGLGSWQQQSELIAILDRAVELNLNAILLQVRPAADALYDSPFEPWSEYLTGAQGKPPAPFYDPLSFAVEQAHRRGLELHAWFNPYRARHASSRTPASPSHISMTRPDLVRQYGRYLWMDPGEPEIIATTLRVMLDVVQRYDVDGIHIDDYFYPYPEIGADSTEVPFPDSASYSRYRARGGVRALNDWRRHNVDTLVQQLYARTKATKPWVKVGISPFGIWRPGNPPQIKGFDAYDKLYADARLWLREGWIDYFTPQLYWPIAQVPQSYPVLLDWWLGENTKGRQIWPGHNASRAAGGGAWGPDELNAQVRATRATAATGDIHFSMRALMPARTVQRDSVLVGVATPPPNQAAAAALADRLRNELYAEQALTPPMPWLSKRAPKRPRARVELDRSSREYVVHVTVPRGSTAMWWTVRALTPSGWRSWVLPVEQRRHSIGNVPAAPSSVLVTVVDRTGIESAACEATSKRC